MRTFTSLVQEYSFLKSLGGEDSRDSLERYRGPSSVKRPKALLAPGPPLLLWCGKGKRKG